MPASRMTHCCFHIFLLACAGTLVVLVGTIHIHLVGPAAHYAVQFPAICNIASADILTFDCLPNIQRSTTSINPCSGWQWHCFLYDSCESLVLTFTVWLDHCTVTVVNVQHSNCDDNSTCCGSVLQGVSMYCIDEPSVSASRTQ